MTSPHRIRSQRWIVRANSTEAAFQLRRQLRADWQALLLPAFAKAFDQVSGGEGVIRIPKIELRLTVASPDKFTEQLAELIYRQLAEQLQGLRRQQLRRNEEPPTWQITSARQERFETLLHYLRTGLAAWEAVNREPGEFAIELKEVCREQSAALQSLLMNASATEALYFRLFQLVSPAEAITLMRALLGRISQPWKATLVELLAALLESGERHLGRHLQLELASVVLSEALARPGSQTAPNPIFLVKRLGWPAEKSQALDNYLASLRPTAATLPWRHSKPEKPSADRSATDSPLADQDREISSPAPETKAGVPSEFGQAVAEASRCVSALQATPSLAAKRGIEDAVPWLVTHAGLVLLHPFLPRFFENTGVKAQGSPRLSTFVLSRAAALLHFLAAGHEEIYEYDLPFIKVLLGLKPEMPLCIAAGLIVESDRQESESLLKAAVTHWAALKNTSIDGFRSSFLNRQALLREEESGWKLQVERAAFDVLLDQLPWSMSAVRLPWMKQPIHTEW